MLSKTPRFGEPIRPPYSDLVGPTTYSCETEKPPFQHKAPFLTSSKKESSFFNKSFCIPLIYGARDDMKDRTLGHSLSNKAPRKMYDEPEGVAPTKYTVKTPACPSAFDDKAKHKRLRKLYVCKVPYSVKIPTPTITTEKQKRGYYLDEDEDIHLVPPENIDRTGGPARYGSNMKKSMYDQKYKGTRFGKAERGDCYGINPKAPGPADYNTTDIDFHRDERAKEVRAMARLMTFLPRFLEKQEMLLLKDNFPGPANYDTSKRLCKLCPPIGPIPIVSGAKRFLEEDPTPGPADYDIVGPKYPVSKLKVPFSQRDKRFKPDYYPGTCGPTSYDVPSPLTSRLSKNVYYAMYQPPFSKGAKRVTMETRDGPGPADYTVNPENEDKKPLTSVFHSKTKRWPYKHEVKFGYLNLEKSYKFLMEKTSSNVGQIPFSVGSKKKGFFDFIPSPPCTKYTGGPPPLSKGFFLPQAKRFADPKDDIPGPGAYMIHPVFSNAMYTACKTYNLKLKEEALRMAFRCHPRDTWPAWMKERKRKKKLRWFVKEGKEYVHCRKDMKPYIGFS